MNEAMAECYKKGGGEKETSLSPEQRKTRTTHKGRVGTRFERRGSHRGENRTA